MEVDGDGEGIFRMASPVPGPMTPLDSPPADCWVEECKELLSACGALRRFEENRSPVKRLDEMTDQDVLPARKRAKVPALLRGSSGESLASTAASTPVSTPLCSPLLSPVVEALPALPPLGADYRKMSVPELREQLLGSGSCDNDLGIAVGWEKDELVAVLEEMDRICAPSIDSLEI